MNFGAPFASGFGSHENHIAVLSTKSRRGGVSVGIKFQPTSGFETGWYEFYRNSKLMTWKTGIQSITSPEFLIPSEAQRTRQLITAIRVGHVAPPYDVSRIVKWLEEQWSDYITLNWSWSNYIEVIGSTPDSGLLTSWAFTNLKYRHVRIEDSEFPTRGMLNVSMTVSGGTATIIVAMGTTTLCSGSGAVGGSVTLSAATDDNVSATVNVGALAATISGYKLYIRWPKYMEVKRDTTNPPTTVVATVPFNFDDQIVWQDPSSPFASGTYYYLGRFITDTGEYGTASSVTSETVVGLPNPPTNLAYASGNASAGIVLSFTASNTALATYRLYMQKIGQLFMDFNTIIANASTGATNISIPAGSLTGSPGTARAILRAVSAAGAEEKNADYVELVLNSAGSFTQLPPNNAALIPGSISLVGDLFSIRGTYPTTGEQNTPDVLDLYKRTPTGSYNLSAPLQTAALGTANRKIRTAQFTNANLAADGIYYLTVRSRNSASNAVSSNSSEILVYGSAVAGPTASIDSQKASG